MKDSGIEWIGEIPESWEVHRIKNHFSIISGSGFKTDYQGEESGDLPVCKASDISNAGHRLYGSANYISQEVRQKEGFSVIPAGSILFAKIGEAMKKNNRTLTMVDACADNNCQAMVPQNIHSEYAYYLFSCIDMQWFDNAGTIPCINNTKLLNFKMAYPNMDKQNRIADYLDKKCAEIDAIIAAKEKTNELLKERRQSIIYEAVTKGLDPTVPMKDSGIEWIGEIPESWKCSKAKYYIRISNGFDPKTEGDIPVYGSGSGCFKTCGESKDGPAVLLGRKGTIDIPRYIEGKYWNVDTAFDIKTNETSLLLKYYFYLATCFDYRFYTATTTLPSMTQTSYENMYIPVPDINIQYNIIEYIATKCDEIDYVILNNEAIIEKLKEYRQSVIYEAVTGKVEI